MKRRLWREAKIHRPLLHDRNDWHFNPPTADEIAAFKRLLDCLWEIERQLKLEIEAQRSALSVRVAQKEICDYEVEIKMQFYLRDDDPAWIEDDDNILFEVDFVCEHMLCSDLNWDIETHNEYPLRGYRHPYLFHQLYAHADIQHRDLLRIGRIRTDVEVTVQQEFKVPETLAPP
ncbi:MAG: hypothetical protein ACT4QA_15950 [Panacagrimonas sp.]